MYMLYVKYMFRTGGYHSDEQEERIEKILRPYDIEYFVITRTNMGDKYSHCGGYTVELYFEPDALNLPIYTEIVKKFKETFNLCEIWVIDGANLLDISKY